MSELKMYHISVTKEDIENGVKNECFDCPLAYAISRSMKLPYRQISVVKTIKGYPFINDLKFPKWLEKWVIAFDKGEKVPPIEFAILIRRAPLNSLIVSADHEQM